MALEVSMTGSGTIGDITPGWSVNEFVNSHTIGSTGAGTGSVSFGAKANDDSLLCINNDVVSTVGAFGTVHGVVQSVSQNGLNASLTHGTFLDKFNLDVDVPPIDTGGVKNWFYQLGQQIFGEQPRPDYAIDLYTGPSFNNFWDGQVSYSFPFDMSPLDVTGQYSIDNIFKNSKRSNLDGANGFTYSSSETFPEYNTRAYYAVGTGPMLPGTVGGDLYSDMFGNNRWGSFNFEMMVDIDSSTDIQLYFKSGVSNGAPDYENIVVVTANGSTNTITISGTMFESSASIASLDLSEPILLSFNIGGPYTNPGGVSYFVAKDTHGTIVEVGGNPPYTYDSDFFYVASDFINVSKMYYVNIARIKYSYVNPSYPKYWPSVYHTPQPIVYPFSVDFTDLVSAHNGAYPSSSGIGWELIQQLASAEGIEVAVNADTIYVRDVGTRILDITNVVASPSVTPTSTLSGNQINIPYTDSAFVNGTVYDAADDGNNIISVRAGETTVTSVKHTVHPISVDQPTRSDVWPVNPGEYYVIDSSGLPLLAGEWEAYGASVTVEIDHDDPAAIQITVVGPYTDVTLAGGPYELAASDGSTKYAALKIAGSGVYSGDNVLGLLTGIDPDKYTRTTVNTINNPFISTEEQAYDRGVWAAQKASGPTVTFSAQIPSSSIDGIGLTCGSLVNYRNSTYRIIASTISGIGVTINGERHVTVDDVDALWSAKTVAEYDGFWGNYECQDQIIFPYMEA